MSFSSDTKKKLANLPLHTKKLSAYELYAYVNRLSFMSLKGRGKFNLIFETETPATARRIFTLAKDVFGIHLDVAAKKSPLKKGHYLYDMVTLSHNDSLGILKYFNVIDLSKGFYIENTINPDKIPDSHAMAQYMRGMFMSCGYVSDPNNSKDGYYLEFVFSKEGLARDFSALVKIKSGIKLKVSNRKDRYVAYTKNGDTVTLILSLIGAHGAVLAIENEKISREIRSNANRITNCDIANTEKMNTASERQVRAINKIIDKYGIDYFEEPLLSTAKLRLENRFSSLNELCEIADPPVSRSTLNNRLNKIIKISEKI